jgi:hypothetical protein
VDYDLVGTPITIRRAYDELTISGDSLVIFKGEIAEIVGLERGLITLHCVQSRAWNVVLPPRSVNAADWPDAPSDVIGTALPIVYGDWASRSALIADPNAAIDQASADAGIARAALPVVTVARIATGAKVPTYLVADHQMHTFDPLRVFDFVTQLGRLASSGGGVSQSNPINGPMTFTLVDRTFLVAVVPTDKHASTTGTGWSNLLRSDAPRDLNGSAAMSGAGSIVRLPLPEIPDTVGTFVSASLAIWYSKGASSGGSKPRFGIVHDSAGNEFYNFEDAASPAVTGDVPSLSKLQALVNITSWADFALSDIYFDTQVGGQTLNVHRAVILVKFVENGSLVAPGRPPGKQRRYINVRTGQSTIETDPGTPNTYNFDVAILTAGKGVADATGEYTGAAGTLIQHPVDVMWSLIRERGGAAASEIDVSGSATSFLEAKAQTFGYKALVNIDSSQNMEDTLREIGSQFLLWPFRSTGNEDATWECLAWRIDPAISYRPLGSDEEWMFEE